jgi:hypothetical protein
MGMGVILGRTEGKRRVKLEEGTSWNFWWAPFLTRFASCLRRIASRYQSLNR